ncbi:hypothetical protein B0O99DRAFT_617238 [Bisporella sp. PMI_857]|nr:hypothetical protein B0O99DRAFT_617238 [Bisporella sp. PMI_857]
MWSRRTPFPLLMVDWVSAQIQGACVWKDGSMVIGYVPCDPSGIGNCYPESQACLKSGLCYGAFG